MTTNPETKNRSLRIVLDFMNAEFVRSGKQDREAAYLLKRDLSLKRARTIQETLLAAHRSKSVQPVADAVRDYAAGLVELRPSKDRQRFEMLWNISSPEGTVYVALVNVINGGQFWSLRRCPECLRFFPHHRKQKYCSAACVRSHDSKTASVRTERARQARRFKEIRPKLLRLQTMNISEALDKVPGFDPKLLVAIVEGKQPLKELVSRVKYRNRKILMEAKLEEQEQAATSAKAKKRGKK